MPANISKFKDQQEAWDYFYNINKENPKLNYIKDDIIDPYPDKLWYWEFSKWLFSDDLSFGVTKSTKSTKSNDTEQEEVKAFDENCNQPKFPVVVNLVGAPGAGKSTLAAYIFSKLKMLNVNCELITEFAKDKVWENNNTALANQIYIFAKQYYRMSRCENKVDVLITDSPLILTPLYNNESHAIASTLDKLAIQVYDKYHNLTYFVKRVKKYNPAGRIQNEEQSNQKSLELKEFLNKTLVQYSEIFGDLSSADVVVNDVLKEIGDKRI